MRLFTVLGVACSLSACQTVNGIDISPHPEQGGETFCERNLIVGIGRGALVMGGVAFAAAGHRSGSVGGGY